MSFSGLLNIAFLKLQAALDNREQFLSRRRFKWTFHFVSNL
jgi:hypothetical protein